MFASLLSIQYSQNEESGVSYLYFKIKQYAKIILNIVYYTYIIIEIFKFTEHFDNGYLYFQALKVAFHIMLTAHVTVAAQECTV